MKVRILGAGSIGLYLAQELIRANHNVSGLDLRLKDEQRKIRIRSQINGQKNLIEFDVNSELSLNDEIVFVTLKSYAIDDLTISNLINSPAEILFLQNGLLVKSRLHTLSTKVAIGTITGVQASVENRQLFANVNNSKIIIEMRSNCSKIGSLAVANSLENSAFEFNETSHKLIYEKFVRWTITSCLNIIYDANLGECLKLIDSYEIISGISELATFINMKFNVSINPENVLLSLYRLPNQLVTSSYKDYKKGSLLEIGLELDDILAYFSQASVKSVVLQKWREKI
jgi:ketopantoate reductase